MFVHFSKLDGQHAIDRVTFVVEKNEYHFENEFLHLWIDSNLPINEIRQRSLEIAREDIGPLSEYLKRDGILIAFFKQSGTIKAQRDEAGLSAVYYYQDEAGTVFCSNMHEIARRYKLPLLVSSIQQWLVFDYLWDGQGLYQGIEQLRIDERIVIRSDGTVHSRVVEELNFADEDNKATEEENIKMLRKSIDEAHQIYLREKNIVFLSGGIDSVAMLIALHDLVSRDQIESHSFRVKGTNQDETQYAQSISSFLDTRLKIIERDVSNEIDLTLFRKKICRLNNPYPGIWIFANQVTKHPEDIYFAGQDTRLHTPALNVVDKVAFRTFQLFVGFPGILAFIDFLAKPVQRLLDLFVYRLGHRSRSLRGFRRLSYVSNTKDYLLKFYFKVDYYRYVGMGLPKSSYEAARRNYALDLKGIRNSRALYNYVVSVKWREQYVNDIRYMIDMVKEQGGRLAMPFYNRKLAKFSSSIPFGLATKSMVGHDAFSDQKRIIDKYVLREAFRDKIDDKNYFRAKGVSVTFHILFNQVLTDILRSIISEDNVNPKSVISRLNLDFFVSDFVSRKGNFEMKDSEYLLKIYTLCCVIVFAEGVNNELV